MLSANWRTRRQHDGKKRYLTFEVANSAAVHATKRSGQWIKAYRCGICSKFHIGHGRVFRPRRRW